MANFSPWVAQTLVNVPSSQILVKFEVVRQHEYRRPAVAHEIARHGKDEVGVGAVHLGEEGVEHRHRDVGPVGACAGPQPLMLFS
jgi:hypothetical protein